MKWLAAMPEGFENHQGEITVNIPLTLDTCAWLVYGRAAKAKGWTVPDVISNILCSEDLPYEERGYRTKIEKYDAERDKLAAEAEKGGVK